MTTSSFLLGGVPPGTADVSGTVVRVSTRAIDMACALVRLAIGVDRRTIDCGRIAYLDDRILRDMGLRHDALPWLVHERAKDRVARLHI